MIIHLILSRYYHRNRQKVLSKAISYLHLFYEIVLFGFCFLGQPQYAYNFSNFSPTLCLLFV